MFGLVVPGVGAFGAGMRRLRQLGLVDVLATRCRAERPLLAAETQAPAAVEAPATKEIPPPLPLPVVAIVPPAATASEPRFDAAYLDNPAPVYPPMSRRMGEEGRVILRVFVEANGRASQIQIRTASGSPRLDQAALEAVSRWKFFPAQRGAEAVGAWVLVPIVFNLRG